MVSCKFDAIIWEKAKYRYRDDGRLLCTHSPEDSFYNINMKSVIRGEAGVEVGPQEFPYYRHLFFSFTPFFHLLIFCRLNIVEWVGKHAGGDS